MSAAHGENQTARRGGSGPSGAGGPGAYSDTRERLIEAASRLLSGGGPDAVTMRKVGELAGVSRAAPYRHFHDKDDLLRAVALRSMTMVGNEVAEALPAPDTPAAEVPEALRRAFFVYLRDGIDRPEHYRLTFGEHLSYVDGPGVHEAAKSLIQRCVDAVAQGQCGGAIRAGDPHDMAVLAWSALHGLVTLATSGHLAHKGWDTTADGQLARLVADLVTGLTAREEPDSSAPVIAADVEHSDSD